MRIEALNACGRKSLPPAPVHKPGRRLASPIQIAIAAFAVMSLIIIFIFLLMLIFNNLIIEIEMTLAYKIRIFNMHHIHLKSTQHCDNYLCF